MKIAKVFHFPTGVLGSCHDFFFFSSCVSPMKERKRRLKTICAGGVERYATGETPNRWNVAVNVCSSLRTSLMISSIFCTTRLGIQQKGKDLTD